MRPTRIINFLSRPGTDSDLSLTVSAYAGDEPYNGWLEDREGTVWARLDAFRFRFVKFPEVTNAERQHLESQGHEQIRVPSSNFVSIFDDRIVWTGETIEIEEESIKGFDQAGDGCLNFKSSARKIEARLHAHGWSGIASIAVDGIHCEDIDLFNEGNAIIRRFTLDNPDGEERTPAISPTGII